MHWTIYCVVIRDSEKWWALVSTVMNLGVRKLWGVSWLPNKPLASQEGF